MKENQNISVAFDRIEYRKGLKFRTFEDSVVVLDWTDRSLYLDEGRFRVKVKDLETFTIGEHEEGVSLATGDGVSLSLQSPRGASWGIFIRKLQMLAEKYMQAKNFVVQSGKHSLGTKNAPTRRMPVNRRVFGKASNRLPSPAKQRANAAWSGIIWDKDSDEAKDNTEEKENHSEKGDDDDDKDLDSSPVDQDADEQDELPSNSRRRIKRFGRAIHEDSDDEDIFTTPAVQRIVSPSKTTAKREEEEEETDKDQARISSFFQRKMATPQRQMHTPKRKTNLPTPTSASSARLVKAARKSISQDATWLANSRAAYSPAKLSAEKLFGSSTTDRKTDEDPIQDVESDEDDNVGPPKPQRKRIHSFFPSLHTKTQKATTPIVQQQSSGLPAPPSQQSIKAPTTMTVASPPQPPPIPRNPFRGLRNLGNTCYMNASLQMLYTLTDTMQALQGRGAALTSSVVEVYRQLQAPSSLGPVVPRAIKSAIDATTNQFEGYEQRDAHEFWNYLIDKLHEEFEHPPFPTDDFLLPVQVSLQCTACGYERHKKEIYRDLSIDIVGHPDATASVERSLEHFFRPEIRELKCEKCENGTHASQTMRILERPKVLILHLKRFIFVEKPLVSSSIDENASPNRDPLPPPVEYIFRKNKDPVNVPESLSLDAFEADSSSIRSQYSLKAVVHHIGSRASSGHYLADAVRHCDKDPTVEGGNPTEKEECWVTFDDTNSVKTSWETLSSRSEKKSTAYLLLYKLNQTA